MNLSCIWEKLSKPDDLLIIKNSLYFYSCQYTSRCNPRIKLKIMMPEMVFFDAKVVLLSMEHYRNSQGRILDDRPERINEIIWVLKMATNS